MKQMVVVCYQTTGQCMLVAMLSLDISVYLCIWIVFTGQCRRLFEMRIYVFLDISISANSNHGGGDDDDNDFWFWASKMVMMATMTMMMMSGGGGQVGGDHNGLCARFAPTIHGHRCFPCLSLK